MAEEERDPERELKRAPHPVEHKRKHPGKPVKGLQARQGAEEPSHGGASASLLAALKDVEFPATRQELIEQAGNRIIPLGDGQTVSMSTVLHKTAPAEFGSARDVVAEANAMWDDIERAAHGG